MSNNSGFDGNILYVVTRTYDSTYQKKYSCPYDQLAGPADVVKAGRRPNDDIAAISIIGDYMRGQTPQTE